LSGWPELRTVLAVESIRSVNSAPTKVESEIPERVNDFDTAGLGI
jgi:hypothetical protein